MSITPLPPKLNTASFLRLWQIIGNPKAEPPIPALIPISRSSWLNGVRSGIFPKSVKLGLRSVAWKTEDIQTLISQLGGAL